MKTRREEEVLKNNYAKKKEALREGGERSAGSLGKGVVDEGGKKLRISGVSAHGTSQGRTGRGKDLLQSYLSWRVLRDHAHATLEGVRGNDLYKRKR